MKKCLLALTFLCIAFSANAQTKPESYLSLLPVPPRNICPLNNDAKNKYTSSVHELGNKMETEIRQRKKDARNYAEADRDKAAARMTGQAVSPETATSRKSKISREEKKAMADKMMKKQYGITRSNFKKMSKEEKTAWAMKKSSEETAKMQEKPGRQEALQQIAVNINALQNEQLALNQKIKNRKSSVPAKIKIMEQNAAAQKIREIDPLQREFYSLTVAVTSKTQAARIDAVNEKLQDAKKRYCEKYSPQYFALIDE